MAEYQLHALPAESPDEANLPRQGLVTDGKLDESRQACFYGH